MTELAFKQRWIPQYLEDIHVMHRVTSTYSSTWHTHEELQLMTAQGSSWRLDYQGSRHRVAPGLVTLSHPGEVHRAYLSERRRCSFLGVRVRPHLLQRRVEEMTGRSQMLALSTLPIDDPVLTQLVLTLHNSIHNRQTNALLQQSLLVDILEWLILRHAEPAGTLQGVGIERQPVKRSREYLHEHFAHQVPLETLAGVANLSVYHFSRAFRKETGVPPHTYQIQLRIARARALLLGGKSIGEVALETGFTSQSHLGMHFKRLLGVTPGQYVKTAKS
ncbi:MAG: helix-turn-helix domain-containing protein [Elainellaceae cyanobacterium]